MVPFFFGVCQPSWHLALVFDCLIFFFIVNFYFITKSSWEMEMGQNGVRLRYFFIFILRPSTRFFSKPMSFSLNPSSSPMRLSTFAMAWQNETESRRK